MWLRGVKYTFVTAIEAGIDIAQHICSSEGWGPPADNGDTMRLLGTHGVLTADLAAALRKAVGFGNVLVHEYIQVSDEIVLARLDDLSDIDQFVARRWCPLGRSFAVRVDHRAGHSRRRRTPASEAGAGHQQIY